MNTEPKLRAVIIDDEVRSRETLSILVNEYLQDVSLVGEAKDVPEGVRLIHQVKPDIVFLDIEMPKYTGLQLLEFFDPAHVQFEIIFTTAYSEYALRAFELSAIDYLLKPIQIEQLQQAIVKARKRINSGSMAQRIDSLRINMDSLTQVMRIAVPVSDGLLFVESSEIVYLEADGSYTKLYLNDGSNLLVTKGLKDFEGLLNLPVFLKPHRSYIVNANHVKMYQKKDRGVLIMSNGAQVNVANANRDDVLEKLKLSQINN